MLLVKFTKRYPASFMAHLDILRSFLRGFVRSGIKVKRSEGFNPHALVYFTPPLPLSVASDAEYMCVETDIEPNEFFEIVKNHTEPPYNPINDIKPKWEIYLGEDGGSD